MEEDRISQLPDSIIHLIMSLLDCPKTLIRMSVLSKDWFDVTASFPILKFDILPIFVCTGVPIDITNFRYVTDTFFKYISYTMSRFCKQNDVNAHTFDINADTTLPSDVDILDILERYLGLILMKGLQVLDIGIVVNDDQPMYRLPDILLYASSLTSLSISGCELPPSLTVDVVKFTSLKLLTLRWVQIDERVIECLTSSCPLLEEIDLVHCNGLRRFSIFGLPNLKKVQIHGKKNEIERVDIEAPNLCYLLIDNAKGKAVPFMNLNSCRKLKTFCYLGFPLKSFNDFLSNFPKLENLFLLLTSHCDNVKLSSRSLRRLKLRTKCDLENIVINSPNLLLFEYYGVSSWLNPFLTEHSSHPKTCMKYESKKLVDTLWCQK